MTGGLGNQMFIYAFYMKMKRLFPNTRIDLSDMMHYHVHNGYELHRIFQQLPEDEFCMPQKTKKVIEFLFFKTILERKQDLTTLRAFFKRRLWPLVYFKGFYQDERYFKDIEDEVRGAFAFNTALCNEKTQRMLRQIESDEDAVSLHVRRGDYLQPSVWRNTGCVCQLPYYRDAVRQLEERLPRTPHILRVFRRHRMGHGASAAQECYLYHVEQGRRELARYAAHESLPPPCHLQ